MEIVEYYLIELAYGIPFESSLLAWNRFSDGLKASSDEVIVILADNMPIETLCEFKAVVSVKIVYGIDPLNYPWFQKVRQLAWKHPIADGWICIRNLLMGPLWYKKTSLESKLKQLNEIWDNHKHKVDI